MTHRHLRGAARARRVVVELEHRCRFAQAPGLLVERLRGRRGFLDERRVLLRDLVHLRDRARHLVDPAALLLGRRRDLAHDVRHALHRTDHVAHRAACFVDQRGTRPDARHRRVDQHLDLLGRGRRTLGQAAHLARDDRETAAFLAGPRGFDRRIQRKNVGLERDSLDDRDDVRDLRRTVVDLAHRADHLADHRIALVCNLRRIRGQRTRLACIVRVLFHGARQLFHARRGFLQRRGLLLGARRQVDVAGRDLARGRRDRLAAAAHGAHRVDEPALHLAEAREKPAHLVVPVHDDRPAQVSGGNRVEMRERVGNRAADRTAQRQPRRYRRAEAGQQRDDRQHAQRLVHRFRVIEARLRIAELEVAQRLARRREVVVAHLELLRAVADPVGLIRPDHVAERVALGLQRLPLRGDVLGDPVFLRAARQREVFLPPRVGLRAHHAASLDGGSRIGRAGQQRRTVEREALACGVDLGHRHVDRARHLVREKFARRLVRTRHAVHAEPADHRQEHRQKRHRETDARTNRQVLEHHHPSCVAS
ncbi:hypothetical protein BME24068_02626 [Burkholderia metallica]|nr:hypothetical protein BME24068_02626 [Burkholderia metallica]